jgi:iron complex transport system ATP-binding protein
VTSLLRADNLSVRIGDRALLEALQLRLEPGEFIAVLGRNGCGKSLTMQTLAGLRPVDAGSVFLDERNLKVLSRREIAQSIGVLPQDREESLPLTTLQTSLLGRHPHLDIWRMESKQDHAIAADALEKLGVAEHAHRILTTLSGGEQRRAAMASLLSQRPRGYLLDEPTNHLDPQHQIAVLDLFAGLCREGAAVIATLHDPALADRYAQRVLMMYGDGRWQLGDTREILNAQELSALYLTPMSELGTPGRRAFIPA